ncbi:MAG: hypothetical protein MRERC_9c050 [Mycoplasmataceae bacterium RC_NB112A]|nr:MAG: hypothetical protein MRERC_9c050 [Mycoplasmataceae bacterium RC_NB112A]
MNQIIEKLRIKFLPEVNFKYEICQQNCHHCQEELGCAVWKNKIGDIRDKIKNLQNLEKKVKKLEIDHGLVAEETKTKTAEEIHKTREKIREEMEKLLILEFQKLLLDCELVLTKKPSLMSSLTLF